MKNLKILMLNPPFMKYYSRQSRSPCVTKSRTLYYPYYLAYATGALEKAKFEPKLIDAVARKWNKEETAEYTKKGKFDFIVLDTSTPSIFNDLEVVKQIKKELPESHISMVNTHVTNLPEWTLNQSKAVDSVCIGEFDNTVVFLAEALSKGKEMEKVPGIAFRKGNKIEKTKERQLVENLDDLPFVSDIYLRHFGEKQIKEYFYASIQWPEIQMLTARGCPNCCSFCNIPMKQSYRARSVANVIKEFKFIQENMPFLNEIMIEDDTFPAKKERTIELCNKMIEEGIKLTWSTNARVNTDLETLQKMREAGCRLVCVGFETPTQTVLNKIMKGQTKDMQVEFKKRADKAGILVNGCFILGLPNDTPKTMQATIDFAKFLDSNTSQFYPLMVYPGTNAFEWAKEKGYLSTENFSEWITKEGLHSTVINRPELSSEELVKWCNKARLEFYGKNPKYWLKMIKQTIKNPKEGIRIAKGGATLSRHLIKSVFSKDAKVKK
ncbi:MAG: radical SAM protein [Candidatus Micrarchaeota archaeon]|nr:B12-binding domain-containing radical SAM protein [Candidatus Micrarchaeota archaeon]